MEETQRPQGRLPLCPAIVEDQNSVQISSADSPMSFKNWNHITSLCMFYHGNWGLLESPCCLGLWVWCLQWWTPLLWQGRNGLEWPKLPHGISIDLWHLGFDPAFSEANRNSLLTFLVEVQIRVRTEYTYRINPPLEGHVANLITMLCSKQLLLFKDCGPQRLTAVWFYGWGNQGTEKTVFLGLGLIDQWWRKQKNPVVLTSAPVA